MRPGLLVSLTVVLNLVLAIAFVSAIQYAVHQQFEETMLALGVLYAAASLIVNVGLMVVHVSGRGPAAA
jgi:hypothetical protein